MSVGNRGLIISVIGCTSSVDPLSQETSFSDNVAIQSIRKSEAIERRCMAEHSTDKIPAKIIGMGYATPHGDQTSGESGEVWGEMFHGDSELHGWHNKGAKNRSRAQH